MKAIHKAVAIALGLIAVLWWAVQPPRFTPAPLPGVDIQKQQQCPPGSRLDGKVCVCPGGSTWTGAACTALG